MKGIIKFIKGILSKDSPESSKRTVGVFGFINAVAMMWAKYDPKYWTPLLVASVTLLGIGIADNFFNKR